MKAVTHNKFFSTIGYHNSKYNAYHTASVEISSDEYKDII